MNEPVHVSSELLRQRAIDLARTARHAWIVAAIPGNPDDPDELNIMLLNIGGPTPDPHLNSIMEATFTGLNLYLRFMAGEADIDERGPDPNE
jgi:hypothetical protein